MGERRTYRCENLIILILQTEPGITRSCRIYQRFTSIRENRNYHDEAQALFEAGKRYDVGMHVYMKDTVYVWDFDKFGERDFLNGRMEVVEVIEKFIVMEEQKR